MKPIMNQEAVMMRARRALARMASGSLARAAALLLLLLIVAASPSGQTLPDTLDPVVWFSSPYDDETVSGTVTVDVDAYDASGIGGVILEVDGVAVGAEDTSAPWSFAWNADASGQGSHILTAVVRDNAGNATRSDVVPVVVGTYVPPPPPPPVNHNPVAGGDSLTSTGRVAVNFTGASLLANDSDPDGDPLVVTSVDSSSTGGGAIASLGGGSYRYTPGATFTGTDTFTYAIVDARGGVASGTVTVAVTAPAPPTPTGGVVLAFGFEEASGTTAINSANGAFNGTIRQAVRVVAGKIGRALRFDGLDDWVTVQDSTVAGSPLDLTNGMTLEAWVNPTNLNDGRTIIHKERGVGGLSYTLYANDDVTPTTPAGYIRVGNLNQGVFRQPASPLALNTWTHVAMTYDGAMQRIYVNGALVGQRAQTGNIQTNNGALRIGGSAAWGEFFQGMIDEVRIYNRALSAAEIAADMSAPVVP